MKRGNYRDKELYQSDLENPSVGLNCVLIELFKKYGNNINLPDWVTEDKPTYTVEEIQGLVNELDNHPTNEDINILKQELEELINSVSSGYIAVNSLVLPIPSSDGGYSWLTEGTYTQENGSNIVVNEGELVLVSFDGNTWSVNQITTLPINSAIFSNDLFDI